MANESIQFVRGGADESEALAELRLLMGRRYAEARQAGRPVGCAAVAVDHLEALVATHGPDFEETLLRRVAELVFAKSDAGEILGFVDTGRILLLVPGPGPQGLGDLAQELIDAARCLEIEVGMHVVEITLSVGLADDQRPDRLHLDTLFAVAEHGVAVAQSRGGDQHAHTELYRLFQRRFEREGVSAFHQELPPEPPPPASSPASAAPATPSPSGAGVAAPPAPPGALPRVSGDPRPSQGASPTPAPTPGVRSPATPPVSGAPTPDATALPGSSAAPPAAEAASQAPPAPRLDWRAELAGVFAAMTAGELTLKQLEERIGSLFEQLGARVPAAPEETPGLRREVDLLQRRLAKTIRALRETEQELEALARLKGVDLSVPSAYRSVQGLSASDSHYELKKALMGTIFRANYELQVHLSSGENGDNG